MPSRTSFIIRRVVFLAVLTVSTLIAHSTAWGLSVRTILEVSRVETEELGRSVSPAGDVNGDGYDDVIVGAPFNGEDGTNRGRAYVYFGGTVTDSVPDLVLTGEAVGDLFGYSVSVAGDVNDDGYVDLIVGAPYNDAWADNVGRAYVYHGGPGMDAVADVVLTGFASGGFFGLSVSDAGDFNGDGQDDVIVAAPSAFAVYVFYGGPFMDGNADVVLPRTGTLDGFAFGESSVGGGDLNADGYDDVIVGSSNSSFEGTWAGRAYVYYGGASPNGVADLVLPGPFANDFFGAEVSAAGDYNGDSYADWIVGTSAGRAYVYFGGASVDSAADLVLGEGGPGSNFGISVSGAADLNRDGYADVIVGAPSATSGLKGQIFMFYGGPTADAGPDIVLTGPQEGDYFGWPVSGAGDVNGDGYPDVIVGAPNSDTRGNDAGRVWVYTTRPFEVVSPNGGEQWVAGTSRSVVWLGTDLADIWMSFDGGANYSLIMSGVGGDDRNEFSVTVPTIETSGAMVRVSAAGEPVTHASSDASNGIFRIVPPASAAPPSRAAIRLQLAPVGTGNNDSFGRAVSAAGDMNGDGYGDFVVGAPDDDTPFVDGGSAYVFLGGPIADLVPDLWINSSPLVGDRLGSSVSSAGDVNGDGYADIIVGSPENDQVASNAGAARVVYGGSPLSGGYAPLLGEVLNDRFGTSVAGAGDVDGDGFADVIVGAPDHSGGRGRAYVYFGGSNLGLTSYWSIDGEVPGDKFGYSVSSAGDMNGDGYSDVIVGARSAGGTGRAYVYFGGRSPNTTPDMVLKGAAAFDFFGETVAGAGDVNGDGFADVVVGAAGSNVGGVDAGQAFVFFGGAELDEVADLTMEGEAAGDFFGISVATAGDANGDGFADIVVGAFQNDQASNNGGRAYVFYGGSAPDELPDLFLNAQPAGGAFGIAVASAGDVNADGFSDVIVGASSLTSPGGFGQGGAYVFDMNRYHLLSPKGGETWNVGSTKTVSWAGAEPADIWLSADGGITHELVESGVGGSPTNVLTLRVPHTPTKFGRVRIAPTDPTLSGFDRSDSLFTIQTSVALLNLLAAPLPDGGVQISWATNPGPEDLAGYRLEKAQSFGGSRASDWVTLVSLTRESAHVDPLGGPGARYRLFAVNGFGEPLWIGETALPPQAPLAAWPVPYRDGMLTVSFAAAGGLGAGGAGTEVGVYDVGGRLVRSLASGPRSQGYHLVAWDGCDHRGREVPAGIYFLHSRSGGEKRTVKITVLR